MTASLYIHVPFCLQKCDYCDFYSLPVASNLANQALMDPYIDAVSCDIEEQIGMFNVDGVPSVYIGGGTPSALGAERITRLLASIKKLLAGMDAPPAEFTVETNPESTNGAFLQACLEGGVSRISLGVQSFCEASRKAVRRQGGLKQIEEALSLIAWYYPKLFR